MLAAGFVHATTIITVDVFDHKPEQARQVSATHLINAHHQDPQATTLEIICGRGMSYAVRGGGKGETMQAAFHSVRDKGGLCVLPGNLPYGDWISLDPFVLINGKRIIGTWGGEAQADRDVFP